MPTNEEIEAMAKRLENPNNWRSPTFAGQYMTDAAAMLRLMAKEREAAGKIAKAETIVAKIRLERANQ